VRQKYSTAAIPRENSSHEISRLFVAVNAPNALHHQAVSRLYMHLKQTNKLIYFTAAAITSPIKAYGTGPQQTNLDFLGV